MRKHIIWKGMRKSIYDILAECKPCLLYNEDERKQYSYPLLIGECFELLGIDTLGPLSLTRKQNKFVLIAIDYLSKYVIMQATKDKNMNRIADFIIEKIIHHYGCPNVILSGNGKEYKNSLVEEICRKLEIKKKYSSPYYPQTNGLVERRNRTILAILSKNEYKENNKWDKYLSLVQFNYNIRFQTSLNASLFEIMYGRNPNLPYFENKESRSENVKTRIQNLKKAQEKVMFERRKKWEKSKKEIKKHNKVKVGDTVYYENMLRKNKLYVR